MVSALPKGTSQSSLDLQLRRTAKLHHGTLLRGSTGELVLCATPARVRRGFDIRAVVDQSVVGGELYGPDWRTELRELPVGRSVSSFSQPVPVRNPVGSISTRYCGAFTLPNGWYTLKEALGSVDINRDNAWISKEGDPKHVEIWSEPKPGERLQRALVRKQYRLVDPKSGRWRIVPRPDSFDIKNEGFALPFRGPFCSG